MTYTVDMMVDRMISSQIYSFCFHTHSVCDIIYIGYDAINIVGAMTYKQ